MRLTLPGILSTICALIDEDLMTNDEQIYAIEYGTYSKIVDPAEAVRKIAQFFA